MSDNNETTEKGGDDLATIVADLQKQLEKVNSKNRELIAEKQTAKQAEVSARQEAEEAATRAAEKNGDIEALKASHERAIKAANDKVAAAHNELRTIKVDGAIADAVAKGNVRPEMVHAVTLILKNKLDAGDDATIDGKPVAEAANEYLSSAEGKHFVRASDATGGGATGSDGGGHRWTRMPQSNAEWNEFDKMSDQERSAVTDRLKGLVVRA